MWIISITLLGVNIHASAHEPAFLDYIGIIVWLTGLFFEAVGDYQLAKFKSNINNKGKVLNTGLWRYTRHPNYFGDICVWCGFWLIAAETQLGLWALPGPLLLIFLLTRWSGGPSYERRLTHQLPGYDDYIRRTSSLIPWTPKPADRSAP